MENAYKSVYKDAENSHCRVIASKYASKQGLKGWAEFKYRAPVTQEKLEWLAMEKANADLITGKATGVIALDFDCEDAELIAKIEHLLPPSKCEKVGAKGWTRFFKYTETFAKSLQIKCKGKVVVEILSDDKKTTIPPSRHPSGCYYEWTGEPLWKIKDQLEPLPPIFLSNIRSILAAEEREYSLENAAKGGTLKINAGRNDACSSYLGTIIESHLSLDEQLKALVEYDKENNEPPLFTDEHENGFCLEPYTNALKFYTNHLHSFNVRKARENKEPIIPRFNAAINMKNLEIVEAGKSRPKANEKQESILPLANASTALGQLQRTILENSYVEQPAFAISASLALFSTILSRKLVFEGMSPNLYILNIGSSGTGKDFPQQSVKRIMNVCNADNLLGAGDYVSDASLMDTLETQPIRLDLMDEVSGLFSSLNKGDAPHNKKMGEILCELFSCSNDLYLGRQTAGERKGKVNRPNVNILGSTTPAAFRRSISRYTIETGLLGRFLIFHGDNNKTGRRVEKAKPYPAQMLKNIAKWANFEAGERHVANGLTTTQKFENLKATEEASIRLEEIFQYYEKMKVELSEEDIRRPIVRRLYQQLLKLCVIHACGRTTDLPDIELQDVEYAKKVIDYHFNGLYSIVVDNLFESQHQELYMRILKLIPEQGISLQALCNTTLDITNRKRESLLKDMVDNKHVAVESLTHEGEHHYVYKRIL